MVPTPDSIYRAIVDSCNLFDVIVIYYPPDECCYKTETSSAVNINELSL
jgi:hypothetical protein